MSSCSDYAWSTAVKLMRISLTLILTSLFILNVYSHYPIQKIGEHFFLRDFGNVRIQCIPGYDSSLGSMSSWLMKNIVLVCVFLWMWSGLILLGDAIAPDEVTGEYYMPSWVPEGLGILLVDFVGSCMHGWVDRSRNIAIILTWICMFLEYRTILFVSHPGGARKKKICREPKWEKKASVLKEEAIKGWRCVVAEESHEVSSKLSGDGVELTGEPVGRQMWTCDESRSKKEGSTSPLKQWISENFGVKEDVGDYDENYIQNLASGGRDYEGFDPSSNPNSCDRIFRAQQIRNAISKGRTPPDLSSKPKTAAEAAKKGFQFYSMLQTEDGHWAGDYGGPHFLMPGIIIAWYVMGKPETMIDFRRRTLMLHYLSVHQQSDGGWGTHIESPSTMFGTVLCYVSMRLLGASEDSEVCKKGRSFILKEGGALYTSSWSKFWLCLLGCMEWEGHNSVPPEMWLLPNWFPFHPGRLWCHCRMVYLPMGYLYGSKFVYENASTDPLIASLRDELYCEAYTDINWSQTRHFVAPMDNYSPIPTFMKFAQNALAIYESFSLIQPFKNFVRKAGLNFCVEYMAAEDLQTNYIDIGPVNKALNMVSAFHVAGNDLKNEAVKKHMARVPDYLWVAEDGMKMQGYNGSQCWDTSFAIQAMSECKLLDEFPSTSSKVWEYLEKTQILSTKVSQSSPAYGYESAINRNLYYRHVSKGGWPFSTSAHGWPISDCTGEGLKAVLCLRKHSMTISEKVCQGKLKSISNDRLFDAVNVLLTLQNEDGGWATYENNRGFGWYEYLNPSEVFGDIMIDYSYVECSMATLTGLSEFHEEFSDYRKDEILNAIKRGCSFMKRIQRKDGSWYGSWACCFCYGAWFGIEGLVAAGESVDCLEIKKCCDFLLTHQRENGGWGEDFTSCYDKDYAENGMKSYGDQGSGVVNTAWALLALSAAKCENVEAVKKGVRYLMERQLPSGDWPQEGIAGVFNRACGITYTAYRNVFPLWALGRCSEVYGKSLDS